MVFNDQPDAALLILCGELRILQAEWQALWNLTSEDLEPRRSADHDGRPRVACVQR